MSSGRKGLETLAPAALAGFLLCGVAQAGQRYVHGDAVNVRDPDPPFETGPLVRDPAATAWFSLEPDGHRSAVAARHFAGLEWVETWGHPGAAGGQRRLVLGPCEREGVWLVAWAAVAGVIVAGLPGFVGSTPRERFGGRTVTLLAALGLSAPDALSLGLPRTTAVGEPRPRVLPVRARHPRAGSRRRAGAPLPARVSRATPVRPRHEAAVAPPSDGRAYRTGLSSSSAPSGPLSLTVSSSRETTT